jgi:hypothetical protein
VTTDPVEILNERNAEVAKIRGYADLTEEAKQRRIAEVNERAQAEYREAVEANERERAERLERSKKAVFRIPIPHSATDGEAAQIRAAYRSARAEVESAIAPSIGADPAYTQGELERFLEQAELTGDGELARAAYHLAIGQGVQSVVDSYLASRPAESRAWESYTTAHQEVEQSKDIGHLFERALTERALGEN